MRIVKSLAVMAATVAAGVGVASPARAQAEVTYPAVTACEFTGLYADYQDGKLSGLKTSYAWNVEVTVSDGDDNAWFVTVNRDGQQGWMESRCVLFLA